MLDTDSRRESLARLSGGLETVERFLLVTGEAGTGKTALVRAAIALWGPRAATAFVADPALAGTDLLEEILRRFSVEPPAGATRPALVAAFERLLGETSARGQVPVLVIDDAHELPRESLDGLRLLANVAEHASLPLTIVLVGLPSLESRLDEPAMAPLRQRVATRCRLVPFSAAEVRRYLNEVVGDATRQDAGFFPRKTCREIHARTGGAPRMVHLLAREAMRLAREGQAAMVAPEHVEAAARTLGYATVMATPADEDEVERTGAADAAPAIAPAAPPPVPAPEIASAAPASPAPSAPEPAHAPPAPARAAATPAEPAAATPGGASVPAAHAAPAAAPIAASAEGPHPMPPAAGGEHRVEDWVGRFIAPDEPRFGSLLRGEVTRPPRVEPEPHEPVAEPAGTEAAPEPEEPTIFHGAAPRAGSRRGHGRRGRSSWALPAAAAGIAIAVVAAVIVLPRLRSARPAPATQVATVEPAPPARHHGRRATREARPAESGGSAEVRAARDPAAAAAVDSTATTRAQKYSLDVGSYLGFVRAREERDRLAATAGLRAWVVSGGRDGGYHVVLGVYRTRERAESAVGVLLDKGLVSGAQVVPLPPRHLRD